MDTITKTHSYTETEKADREDLQNALEILHITLHEINNLPAAVNTFTPLDRVLVEAMSGCVGVLRGRCGFGDGSELFAEGEGRKKDKKENEPVGMVRSQGLENLVVLLRSAELLASEGVVECGEEEGSVKEDDGWVDVAEEDVRKMVDHDETIVVDGEGAVSDEMEKGKNDVLSSSIATSTQQILTTRAPTTQPRLNTHPIPPPTHTFHTLCTLVKSQYPDSSLIQTGQFEFLNADDRDVVLTDKTWKGQDVVMAVILDGLVGVVERGVCPMLGCSGRSGRGVVRAVEEGGWICQECGVWFTQGSSSSSSLLLTNNTENNSSLTSASSTRLPESEFANNSKQQIALPEAKPLTHLAYKQAKDSEDLSVFKYVKTYPLTTLSPLNERFYECKKCATHLALCTDISSRNFRGHHGKAYLFSRVFNVARGETEERMMTTGKHEVCNVFCRGCGGTVGWAYESAREVSEAYKIGKFILESELVVAVGWEREWVGDGVGGLVRGVVGGGG